MASPCRVTVIATVDDRSVLVEDAGNPNILLRGLEGDRRELPSLVHRAWRETLRTRDVSDIDLRLGHNLSFAQRSEILECLHWLIRHALKLPQKRPPRSVVLPAPKPPSRANDYVNEYVRNMLALCDRMGKTGS